MDSVERLPLVLSRLRQRLADGGGPLLVLSGAGLSATAGLPTYRGQGGVYSDGGLPPLHAVNATTERVHIIWDSLAPIVVRAREAAAEPPSAAYAALAQVVQGQHQDHPQTARGQHNLQPLVAVTQNIDGLHQTAGVPGVLELHGSLARVSCLDRHCALTSTLATLSLDAQGIPRCPACGEVTRPDVVLFGELLDQRVIRGAFEAAAAAAVVLAVGTSLQVNPAAGVVAQAVRSGAEGLWLDLDPVGALVELGPGGGGFGALTPVPGDLNQTLPEVVDGLF